MIKANFNTYNNYVTDSLYQWDLNQDLIINGLNLSVAPEIHFANANMDRAIVRQSTLSSGVVTVRIPNSLLQEALTIKAYVGVYEDDTFKVIETIEIPVIAKTRPSDYALTDTDEEIYSFNKLENEIANAKKNIADQCDDNLVAMKASIAKETKTLSAQVANIVAHNNDTEGNTELLDMRVDYEGNTHASAGEAVRYQTNKLSEEIEGVKANLYNNEEVSDVANNGKTTIRVYPFEFVQGSSASGEDDYMHYIETDIRCRAVVRKLEFDEITIIPKSTNYLYIIHCYEKDEVGYKIVSATQWSSEQLTLKINANYYYNMIIKKSDESIIDKNEINENFTFSIPNRIYERMILNSGEVEYTDSHVAEYNDFDTHQNITKFIQNNSKVDLEVTQLQTTPFGWILTTKDIVSCEFSFGNYRGWICVDSDDNNIYMIPLINDQKGKLYTINKETGIVEEKTDNPVVTVSEFWETATQGSLFKVEKTNGVLNVYMADTEAYTKLFEYTSNNSFGFLFSRDNIGNTINCTFTEVQHIKYPTILQRVRKLENKITVGSEANANERFSSYKVIFAGDSITEKNSRATINWVDCVTTWLNITSYTNEAVGGTGIIRSNGDSPCMLDRVDNWVKNANLILIMGNMNDYSGHLLNENTLGVFGDTSLETEYGVVNTFLQKVMNKYPLAKIGWIISTPREYQNDAGLPSGYLYGKNSVFENASNAIKEVCENYSIPVLDLFHNSNLHPWNDENRKEYFSTSSYTSGDGVHPNDKGQKIIAYKILDFIKSNF